MSLFVAMSSFFFFFFLLIGRLHSDVMVCPIHVSFGVNLIFYVYSNFN